MVHPISIPLLCPFLFIKCNKNDIYLSLSFFEDIVEYLLIILSLEY